MIDRQVQQWVRKLWIGAMAVMIAALGIGPIPVQAGAAEHWMQYAKIGKKENMYLGSFSNPRSVVVDSKGNVYVADTGNNRIQKLTIATGEWSMWGTIDGKYGGALGEFQGPQGLAVDQEDNLYVADSANHRIQKFDAKTRQWSEIGLGKGTSLGMFMDPKGVAMDKSGNIYVADSGNHRIQQLDSNGHWKAWNRANGGSGSGVDEFYNPTRIAVDGAGNLYVADRDNHRIQKLDVSAGGEGVWHEWKGSDALGGFKFPTDVAVDRSGNVYVADRDNHRIQKLDLSSGGEGVWSVISDGLGDAPGQLKNPSGVALDSSGNIYVADTSNHRIQKLTVSTEQWSEWGYEGPVAGTSLGEFHNPSGVEVDKSGNMYVADFYNNRIQKFDAGNKRWEMIGNGMGAGIGQLDGPTDIAIDGSGNLYVADKYNQRIQKMTPDGVWSLFGTTAGLSYPSGVAVSQKGDVYVADPYEKVLKWNEVTRKWDLLGGKKECKPEEANLPGHEDGCELGGFNEPGGVEVDDAGNIYVVDTLNHRILKRDESQGDAALWKEWGVSGQAGSGLGEFNEPYDIAIDSKGNLYVADSGNHRIQKLNAATGVWSEWGITGGRPGAGLGEFNSPLGVAVDRDGYLYVAEFGNHRIQRMVSEIVPPSAPTDIKAEVAAGESQAIVTFNAPSNDGGSDITSYSVTSSPGDITVTGTGSPISVTGLTYGTAYTFTVVATNSAGSSAASAASNAVTPTELTVPTVPGTPTEVTAEVVMGESQATVEFNAPTRDGGSPITGYTVTSQPGGLTATGTASPITVTGLTYGTAYTFTVAAINDLGVSKASAPSNEVVPLEQRTVPGAPTKVTAVASDGEATIAFTAPVSDGGSPITSYTVVASPGGHIATGTGSPIKVTGLTNGTKYTFIVIAMNEMGSSLPSVPSNDVTPRGSETSHGGGSGPVTTPALPSEPDAIVFVNGKSVSAGKLKVTKNQSQQVSTITIDPKKLEEKLAKEGQGAVVTISAAKGSDVMIGELDGQMLQNMAAKQAVLQIRTEQATYTLPTQRVDLQAILAQFGKSAALKDITIQVEITKPKQQVPAILQEKMSMVVPPVAFTVRAQYQDKTVEVELFSGYVERTLAIPAGVDPNKITTGVVVNADGSLRHVPTKVMQEDGQHYAVINSLTNSQYAVIWNPLTFADVTQHWAKDAVNDMGSRLVVQGDGQGAYHPDAVITRAEFAAIVVRGLGLEPKAEAGQFSDVEAKDWFAGAVGTAWKHQLITGFEGSEFRPNDKITREQAMAIMARAMDVTGLKAKSAQVMNGQPLASFADAELISGWAKKGALDCLQFGILSGRNHTELDPKAVVTRAEVAAMIQKLLKNSDLI
ncbi:fibronectin type III domain-containing protein [Paenibacillus terrigena]|uniref:fibronectin type III domain-containing protein n=1 Tax=Paenibacillus terrigena TaxID=369333 RepID=UPI0028D386A7|nr:fibronectin type III domain-containing protein [Paenibacillus terrigena]